MRTLEQMIKFDSGLTLGTHPVTIRRRDGSEYAALVDITVRGTVRILPKPGKGDMYTSWHKLKGDTCTQDGGTIVWGARDPELLRLFDNPVTTISFARTLQQ